MLIILCHERGLGQHARHHHDRQPLCCILPGASYTHINPGVLADARYSFNHTALSELIWSPVRTL